MQHESWPVHARDIHNRVACSLPPSRGLVMKRFVWCCCCYFVSTRPAVTHPRAKIQQSPANDIPPLPLQLPVLFNETSQGETCARVSDRQSTNSANRTWTPSGSIMVVVGGNNGMRYVTLTEHCHCARYSRLLKDNTLSLYSPSLSVCHLFDPFDEFPLLPFLLQRSWRHALLRPNTIHSRRSQLSYHFRLSRTTSIDLFAYSCPFLYR